jgi:hypothetical protein
MGLSVVADSTSESPSADELLFSCELRDEQFETRADLNDHDWEYHEMDGDITTP